MTISRPLFSAFLVITELTCQFIPLFPNHSDCFSLYFSWMNFMAQSMTIREAFFWRDVSRFCFALAWFLVLMICAFHWEIASLTSSWSCFRSSFFSMLSKVIEGDSISFPIAWITDFKLSQLSQLTWCSWEQLPWNSGFWGSLKQKHLQWSGKRVPSSWQCIPYSVFRYRLASFSVLRTSSHYFSVALPSSNSSTILYIASNPSAPLAAMLSSPWRDRLWEASLTCKIL